MASSLPHDRIARETEARTPQGVGLVLFGASSRLVDARRGVSGDAAEALVRLRRAGWRTCLCVDGVPATLPAPMTGRRASGWLSCAGGALLLRARTLRELASRPLSHARALEALSRLAELRPAWRVLTPDGAYFEVAEPLYRSHAPAAPLRVLAAVGRSMAPARGSWPVRSASLLVRELEEGDVPVLGLEATFADREARDRAATVLLLHRGLACRRTGEAGLRVSSGSAGHAASARALRRHLGVAEGRVVAVMGAEPAGGEEGLADEADRTLVADGPRGAVALAEALAAEEPGGKG